MSGWGAAVLPGFSTDNEALNYCYDAESLRVEPWGPNALRIRASRRPGNDKFPSEDWALSVPPSKTTPNVDLQEDHATITNGSIKASISLYGKLTIVNVDSGTVLLEEYARHRRDKSDPKCSALDIEGREFDPTRGGEYHLTMRFESQDPDEKIYGMGQYQTGLLNLKGQDLELAQRNSQASVPFMVSSRGYGLLWNQPAVGRAVFGVNIMSFEAYQTQHLDYWVVAGESPAELVQAYARATGTVPMMPEYGLGYWQSKCRYMTQEEVLKVAREYHERKLPMDVLVIDFFHWLKQGDFAFDARLWPDPAELVKQCAEMGIQLMVSVWPTMQKDNEHYPRALQSGYLVQQHKGLRTLMDFRAECGIVDFTNPEAREFVWDLCKKNYYDYGIKIFWLDEAEPEFSVYHFDNVRLWSGNQISAGNAYPRDFVRTFYEGMTNAGQDQVVNLIRCAWAGSQKYGALVWSGDTASSFGSFRDQVAAGLNMGMAGIPWWTSDIGGFHGGDGNSPAFQELLARWFFFGAFSPVFRMHGDRENGTAGSTVGSVQGSGGDNEVWSFGPQVYEVCVKYLKLRELLREYIRGLMREAHEKGSPITRPMFYEFPKDEQCWERSCDSQYMFGSKYLVAPVMTAGAAGRSVYVPKDSKWQRVDETSGKGQGEFLQGGQRIEVHAPWTESNPLFVRVF
ncbi:hypothetical protein LTR91_016932 [Friedmanniomyces endolithicus]|uniref:Glycoside hydrolase family 31 N-terminal domain-containing protein n=1 Tax=Friedmanniomyces endolithicus TaxID=329885 RepID=A0AAN6K736_9PEZI|nr:hypothetical protein LTR94_016700 [Friedmanniomyces endolithicus]KAK0783010.1 hypothetical protein LTR59_011939 [Friedmanniomyces endolithicus]KAK0814120.1 hypothetical protein LTR38_002895 [Friedmanniomyces endolithicus]KAK0816373.1 hypothetical protein LTR75_003599 [Friedmanniomyces endolithicus]KAK0857945.1 hypothetical protein LTR03_000511 [Friedmanniomyces endolithicus]